MRIKYAKKRLFYVIIKVHRPVTRGAEPPLKKFSPTQEKCVGHILKLLDVV